jgi:predicted nucleic acid-binding protein
MPINNVVVNASPLICLFKSGLQGLLPGLFQDIYVPEAVLQEVTASGKKDFPATQLAQQTWITVAASIPVDIRVAAWNLGRGESEVISFALQNPVYRAVLDDREARRCAETLGCKCIGTAGILVLAKRRKLLFSLREAFAKLTASGIWLSSDLIEELCRQENENP